MTGNEIRTSFLEFFQTSIDKMKFSEKFGSVVHTPKFHTETLPKEFPVLIRKTLTSAASDGIVIVNNEKDFMENWRSGYVWTEYFHHDIELRVYVLMSKEKYDIRIYKKVPRDDARNSDVFICGIGGEDNTAWVLRDQNYYPKVVRGIQKILPELWKLGGRFVAFDTIYSTKLQDYVFLEMNSGPWVTQRCAEWVARFFIEFQGKKYFK